MCLYLRRNRKDDGYVAKPITAKVDKICYKQLNKKISEPGVFETPYIKYRIIIGQKLSTPHLGVTYTSVEQGIHAYTNIKAAMECLNRNQVIVECTIPKGAKYIIGKYNEIVATEMKLKKIIYRYGDEN